MSFHNNPKYQIPELIQALKDHGLEHDTPSQLADAFRTGWLTSQPKAPAPVPVVQGGAIRWHELKTDPDSFDAVMRGEKTCEIRRNDRNFKVGDGLLLRRTKYTGNQMHMRPEHFPLEYTGEECRRIVSHVLTGYGLEDNCALSFATPANMAVGAVGGVGAVDKAHLPDLRYIRMFLLGLSDEKHRSGDLSAAINGINYIISRTESATPAPEQATTGSGQELTQDEIDACITALRDHDGSYFEPECPGCTAYKKLAAILSTASPAGEWKA